MIPRHQSSGRNGRRSPPLLRIVAQRPKPAAKRSHLDKTPPKKPPVVSTGEGDLNGPVPSPRRLRLFLAFFIVIFAIVSLALTACAAKPPKPVKARAQLVVSSDVNPDTAGRASPIVVRLFQLKNDGEFAAADFFALYEKEKETLGTSLISREEYVLAPGETRTLEMPINADARFVGAVAAYRDIRAAHWRALTRTPEKKLTDLLGKHGLTLSVGKDTVTLAVED